MASSSTAHASKAPQLSRPTSNTCITIFVDDATSFTFHRQDHGQVACIADESGLNYECLWFGQANGSKCDKTEDNITIYAGSTEVETDATIRK
jgi:hypothetical protein